MFTFISIRCGITVFIEIGNIKISYYLPSYETLCLCDIRGEYLPKVSWLTIEKVYNDMKTPNKLYWPERVEK